MLAKLLRGSAVTAVVLGALAAAGSSAQASSMTRARLDGCTTTCAVGGCSAETPWYDFWDDCRCWCLPDGRATCSCY